MNALLQILPSSGEPSLTMQVAILLVLLLQAVIVAILLFMSIRERSPEQVKEILSAEYMRSKETEVAQEKALDRTNEAHRELLSEVKNAYEEERKDLRDRIEKVAGRLDRCEQCNHELQQELIAALKGQIQ